MFIGRTRELEYLNKLYQTDTFQFPVIYGRRRVGKTALISEFVKDKEAIFFTGVETNAKQNLENLSQCIMRYATGMEQAPIFASFQAALEYVFRLSETKRLILVIDEYPYIAKASRSFASTLQMLIDQYKASSKLFLILCGSSMSFMEDQVLAYKAPLYGRKTAQFKILPFDFFESCQCFSGFSAEDMAMIYAIVGGTPQYLLMMDDKLSVEENIKSTLLNPASALYEEPSNLLKQEVREPAIYNAIITAIAGGASRLSEIAGKVGEETSACAAYIKNLISLGVVTKEMPLTEKSTRKTIYTIGDNLFRFWYRFIPDHVSAINRGLGDIAYQRIAPQLSTFMGKAFEEICKQYLWRLNTQGKAAFSFTELGRWWGNDPKHKCETEIDIMGTDGISALFGECKWTNQKVDVSVLETLTERSKLFHYDSTYLYLFAKAGYTKSCIEEAKKMEKVALVTFTEMMKDDNFVTF